MGEYPIIDELGLYRGLYTTHELRSGYFCHSKARVQFSQGSSDCFSTYILSEFLHGKIHKSLKGMVMILGIEVLWKYDFFSSY